MKSLKEIEKLGLEELMEVSSDETVTVPEGFMDRIDDAVGTMKMLSGLTEDDTSDVKVPAAWKADVPVRRKRFRKSALAFIAGAAAAVALLIDFMSMINEPEDTFDDPRLAYAEVEKAFARISDSVSKGIAMAEDLHEGIRKTSEVFD